MVLKGVEGVTLQNGPLFVVEGVVALLKGGLGKFCVYML